MGFDPTITAAVIGLGGLLVGAVISAPLTYRYGKKHVHDDMRLQELTETINGLSERIVYARHVLAHYALDNSEETLGEFGLARFSFFSFYAQKYVQLGDIYDKLEQLHDLFLNKGNAIVSFNGTTNAGIRQKARLEIDEAEEQIELLVKEIMTDLETKRGVWIKKDNALQKVFRYLFG